MYIKYLNEEQIVKLGFTKVNESNLCAETYSLYNIDLSSDIHTAISLYDNINSYQYKIYTSLEGTIENGVLTNITDLEYLVNKHIKDNVVTFFERLYNKQYSLIEKDFIRNKFVEEA